jgi:alpha-L-fucosidase 2
MDATGLVGRSDVILGQPNLLPSQALPLGNGRLGVAAWSADGFSAQLNRVDTLPGRLSPGKIVVPGLSEITRAKDYSGRLNLYNGEFTESGGGLTATAYVQPDTDTLIIDVAGADPKREQSAELRLWAPRTPRATAIGESGTLAQTWIDNKDPGASGKTFGAVSAVSAKGRHVSVSVSDPLTIKVTLLPNSDGTFRILVAAPHYDGSRTPTEVTALALANISPLKHRLWWNAFWHHADLIKVSSPDGSADYMENLRTLDLYNAAASSSGQYPGSQAGVADMFSAVEDVHHWDSAAFWHWNLRMQVAANLGAGLPELNAPYFNLYRENLLNIENWTKGHMGGRPGICVPETMRFNGAGIEHESGKGWGPNSLGLDCDAGSRPYYNARTLSTGAEVSLWIWRQYQQTNDKKFLAANYPVMAAAARFLLAYEKTGADGLRHTSPSNAHETQWDLTDPTTDISARMALYPATIQAARVLGEDPLLVTQLRAALAKIPKLPLTQESGPLSLIAPSATTDAGVIATSYNPGAEQHNVENLGLEPVWPYDLIGDSSPLFELARRTYSHRPYPVNQDWSFDPIQAARLGLGSEVGATLVQLTEKYQTFVNGFANWGGEFGEFYGEHQGVVADALQEAIVQDYDGIIRIAPAVPPDWDFDGRVSTQGNNKVDVQVRNGVVTTVAIEAGSTQQVRIRNPWTGTAIGVIALPSGAKVKFESDSNGVVQFVAVAGGTYLIEKSGAAELQRQFEPVVGVRATTCKRLGPVLIGLPPRE